MPPDAHSNEFARLIAVWLDDTATAEESAQLWQAVVACPDCALAFAGAARFDRLLEETVQQRANERTVVQQAAALAMLVALQTPAVARKWITKSTVLRIAAGVAVLGLTAWLLRPGSDGPSVAQVPESLQASGRVAAGLPAAPTVRRLPTVVPAASEAVASAAPQLLERLDRFFLAGVALDQVPLRDALGVLQGQLQELNYLNVEVLHNLRITLPTDAAARRVTFHSGPIPFLKAVRALAALGGCDVTLDERVLALVLHREIFPQVPERRDLRNLLTGRLNADGTEAASDAGRVAALLSDAAALGIGIDLGAPLDAQGLLPITRGQWEALLALTETREQLSRFAVPTYHLFLAEDDAGGVDRVIEEQAVPAMRDQLLRGGAEPVVVAPSITPWIALPNQPSALQPLSVQPLGEGIQVTALLPAAGGGGASLAGAESSPAPVTAVLLRGQGLTFSADTAALSSLSSSLGPGALATGRGQVILLPVNPPTPP